MPITSPEPQGDYILRILPSSIKVPITSIEDGLRFQFDGAIVKMPIFGDWLKRISTLTDVRLRQEIHDPQGIIKYLATDINQVDTSWANYSRIIQQDVNLRSRERKSDLRFGFIHPF
jgi:hypothetical protein